MLNNVAEVQLTQKEIQLLREAAYLLEDVNTRFNYSNDTSILKHLQLKLSHLLIR